MLTFTTVIHKSMFLFLYKAQNIVKSRGLKHAARWPHVARLWFYAARVTIKFLLIIAETTVLCGTRALFALSCCPQALVALEYI